MALQTTLGSIEVDGVKVFYRTAGAPTAPVLLLLHGFPASSFQFRNLISLLAHRFRLVAPDLPGFGFTVVPEDRKYQYTFDNIATTIQAFVDALGLKKFAVYMFDYGVSLTALHYADKPAHCVF
jgi:pimeloyl-ACP methyl ester carboxylesterase